MTVLQVAQAVSLKTGLKFPQQVFSSTDRTWLEMGALINECATDIAESYDWQALKKPYTVTGDGSIARPLPSDFERMLRTANVWSSPYLWGMEHVTDTDRWLEYLVLPYRPVSGAWTIYQSQFQMLPELPDGGTASFFYISNLLVRSTGNVLKQTFTVDTDTFLLSEKLLNLCVTYKWKSQKGQPYGEEMADYQQELARLMDKDGGSKPILSGRIAGGWWRP